MNPPPTALRLLDELTRILAGLGVLAVLALLMSPGLPPAFAVFFMLAFLLGVFRPWWALSAMAFLGPLSLLGPGYTFRLIQAEALVLGALFGQLRREPLMACLRPPLDSSRNERSLLFTLLAWGIVFGVLASSIPGLQVGFGTPESETPVGPGWIHRMMFAFHGYATWYQWPGRALYNWLTGMAIAYVAFREADSARVRQLLLCAAASTVIAAGIGLGEQVGLWSLHEWRAPNPDPLHIQSHRLMSFAGHGGWFAEWIVFTWPGLLFAWGGGRKRKAIVAAAGFVVALALLLTLARAGWLAVALSAAIGIAAALSTGSIQWTHIRRGLALIVVILILAVAINPRSLSRRVAGVADYRDRFNYLVSTFHLAREHPLGIGLGLHSIYYDARFTPFHRFYQPDHTTAHNTWLHLLAEQGPVQAAVIAMGFLAVLAAGWRGWRRATQENRLPLLALLLIVIGFGIESMAQYLGFLRVVEVLMWVVVGALAGLSVRASGGPAEVSSKPRHRELLMIAFAAVAAWSLFLASSNARRDAAHPFPRPIIYDPPTESLAIWTDDVWRFPLDPTWCGLELNLVTSSIAQDVEIRVPDNEHYTVHLEKGEQRGFWFAVNPARNASRFAALRWMEIRCAHTWSPRAIDPGDDDPRRLGIYVFALKPFFCDDDPRRPSTQKWVESDGGMPR